MKNFLKLSLTLVLIFSLLVSFTYAETTNLMLDLGKGVTYIKESAQKVKTKAKTEKSKKTKINYSNTIHVLVTPKIKEKIQSKVYALDNEVNMLAKVIYREARGLDRTHRAAVAWCILNRVDSSRYANSIYEVITSPNQYAWNPNTPVLEEHTWVARDVVTRWLLEKEGYASVGRVLPNDYFFFTGDGSYNYFRQNFDSTTYWNWSLPTPY